MFLILLLQNSACDDVHCRRSKIKTSYYFWKQILSVGSGIIISDGFLVVVNIIFNSQINTLVNYVPTSVFTFNVLLLFPGYVFFAVLR